MTKRKPVAVPEAVSMVGTRKWKAAIPHYLQAPFAKGLQALEDGDVGGAMQWFGDCFNRIPQIGLEMPPEAKPILYFASQAAQSAYFARRGGGGEIPMAQLNEWRDVAGTLVESAALAFPEDAVATHNLGRFLQDDGRYEDAIGQYYRALQLDASQVETWGNLGTLLYEQGDVEGAWAKWNQCVALDAPMATGRLAQSYVWLRQGDYTKGWAAFHDRWKDLEFQRGYGRQKEMGPATHWQGERLGPGDSLLLHGEQGLGDHVQFARYVQVALDQGWPVIGLETRATLKRWMEASFPGVPIYARDQDPLPVATHHASTMDLPYLFGTTLETVPRPVQPAIPERQSPGGTFRVGIAWEGAKGNPADSLRSMPAEYLQHLGDIPGVTWVNLQFGRGAAVVARAWLGERFIDGTEGCEDVWDTAQIMAGLDAIVTVDTVTLHLAGTLGIPTIAMHRYCREWRWLDAGERCPWYPSVRSWTLAAPNDWEGMAKRVRADLAQRASG